MDILCLKIKNFESFLNKSLIKKNYNIYNVSVFGGCQKEALYLLKSNIISNFIKKYQPNIGKSEFIYTYIYQQKIDCSITIECL